MTQYSPTLLHGCHLSFCNSRDEAIGEVKIQVGGVYMDWKTPEEGRTPYTSLKESRSARVNLLPPSGHYELTDAPYGARGACLVSPNDDVLCCWYFPHVIPGSDLLLTFETETP